MDFETLFNTKTVPLRHAFFGIQPVRSADYPHVRVIRYVPHKIELINISTADSLGPFESIIMAENAFIAHVAEQLKKNNHSIAAYDHVVERPGVLICNDEFASLAVMLNRQANLIATRTRRGQGNVGVMSHHAVEVLRKARYSAYADLVLATDEIVEKNPLAWDTNLIRTGTLNSSMGIYQHGAWDRNQNAMIFYKGASELDACAILMAYESNGKPEYRVVLHPTYLDYIGCISIFDQS